MKHNYAPAEPTDLMIEAAYPLLSTATDTEARRRRVVVAIYKTMMENAPLPPLVGLTLLQSKVHNFIAGYIMEFKRSPTYTEIAIGIDKTDRRQIAMVVQALERKKFLKRRAKGKARSIIILIWPGGSTSKPSARSNIAPFDPVRASFEDNCI